MDRTAGLKCPKATLLPEVVWCDPMGVNMGETLLESLSGTGHVRPFNVVRA